MSEVHSKVDTHVQLVCGLLNKFPVEEIGVLLGKMVSAVLSDLAAEDRVAVMLAFLEVIETKAGITIEFHRRIVVRPDTVAIAE